jgi:hypothetical protein
MRAWLFGLGLVAACALRLAASDVGYLDPQSAAPRWFQASPHDVVVQPTSWLC